MKDRETALLERWRSERPMYEAWGGLVVDMLTRAVAQEIHPAKIELFFRIPTSHRTKEEPSLLAKAFHRGKPYRDPYAEIEDKVGVRIVVLFSEEIRIVEKAILTCTAWSAEKARDFEEERARRPFEFDYQSLHYVVRSKPGLSFGGVDIGDSTPCEIQVRTILQHAYSELTHDTIYKPNVAAEPSVKRAAAKSMALIEATDDYFTEVRSRLALAAAPGHRVAALLDALYAQVTGTVGEHSPLNSLIVDHYKKWAKDDFETVITAFFSAKPYLADRIRERMATQLLYRQSGILLIYWVIDQAPRDALIDSPLSDDELRPLYSDLGRRLPSE